MFILPMECITVSISLVKVLVKFFLFFLQNNFLFYIYLNAKKKKNLEEGSAVLIRALEPLEGLNHMIEYRSQKPNAKVTKKLKKELKIHELCNGPSKTCIAMKLDKSCSKYSLCTWKGLWLEDDGFQDDIKIIACPRIGIESVGQEWANKPLRYYIHGHKCVSKKDKTAESKIQ